MSKKSFIEHQQEHHSIAHRSRSASKVYSYAIDFRKPFFPKIPSMSVMIFCFFPIHHVYCIFQAEVSFEEGTSFSGNSNNVFTTGGSEMIPATSAASTTWRVESNNQQSSQPMFTVSFDDSYGNEDPFFPIFDNTILIDPIQRQREHFSSHSHSHQRSTVTTAAVYSEPQRSIVRHNCLNHHPYGTFYYSKKSGRTGRHFPSTGAQPVPPPRVPNSPVLNSHHHTVMAGGVFTSRSSHNNSAESNVR